MGDQCLLRVSPVERELPYMVGFDEWSTWEPCPEPVTFRQREPLAPGGVLRLCESHRLKLVKAGFKAEAQE